MRRTRTRREGGARVSETENARLRQAMRRLMDGQQEALDIVRGALEGGEDARTDDALADLQDVLEGTLEDVRADLGIEEVDEL